MISAREKAPTICRTEKAAIPIRRMRNDNARHSLTALSAGRGCGRRLPPPPPPLRFFFRFFLRRLLPFRAPPVVIDVWMRGKEYCRLSLSLLLARRLSLGFVVRGPTWLTLSSRFSQVFSLTAIGVPRVSKP